MVLHMTSTRDKYIVGSTYRQTYQIAIIRILKTNYRIAYLRSNKSNSTQKFELSFDLLLHANLTHLRFGFQKPIESFTHFI